MTSSPTLITEVGADRVTVLREGAASPLVVQNVPSRKRPYLHPVNLPGTTVAVTEDAPGRTPWQHGIFIGLNDVNGVGFWYEGLAADHVDEDGTFRTTLVGEPRASGNTAAWAVSTTYSDPAGQPMFRDTQAWTLTDRGSTLQLDVEWTIHALVDLHFGKYEYGGLFLRMPFREAVGGTAVNSDGRSNEQAEGQRARWVSVQMPIPGHDGEALVAMFDHPSNLQHPAPWRVDGQLGINPSPSIAGDWRIATGATESFRFRLVAYPAPPSASQIDGEWDTFSASPADTRGEA